MRDLLQLLSSLKQGLAHPMDEAQGLPQARPGEEGECYGLLCSVKEVPVEVPERLP